MQHVSGRQYHNNRVLVVDDEEVVRVMFESLLDDEGLECLLAEDASSASVMIDRHGPALVLVDKNLPDKSGLDLIAEQKRIHPDVEFIMITGYASLDSAVKAMEIGAFSYLTKPFDDIDVVMERIRAALDVTHLRLETARLRSRIERINATPDTAPGASASNPLLLDQILYTISLLESFGEKRNRPPDAAEWAMVVDTLQAAARKLREAVSAEQ